MKRFACALLLALTLLCAAMPLSFATDSSRSYLFDLTADGSHSKQAVTGDIITVTLTLRRTDSDASAPMYAMQDELCYDPAFFQLVEGSVMTAPSVETADLALRDGMRSFYMNFVSLGGSGTWAAETRVGLVQLKVIGQSGASVITHRGYLVSDASGGGSFASQAEDLTVIVSDSCTVHFEANGGTAVEDQIVKLGGRVSRPRDPVRAGYILAGWYTDSDFTREWNFKKDTVQGNMTLYAKWVEGTAAPSGGSWWLWVLGGAAAAALLVLLLLGRKQVRFDCGGGSPVSACRVRQGQCVPCPAAPVWQGHVFAGWYRDAACTEPWDFEQDRVERSMTLYARWR